MDTLLRRMGFADYLLIAVFAFVLFGYSGIGGRPLTMHEARLPQTAREMLVNHHWLLPQSGSRPWLERPPLPHWVVIGAMKLFHRDDREWVVRLPSALMGTIIVLLTGWFAGRAFGRTIGVLAGLVLATSFEFYSYAGVAEDDIYLAALVAICLAFFISAEFFSERAASDGRVHFFKGRPPQVWGFFIALGLTNLAKGPLLGMIVVGSTVGMYLLWNAVFPTQNSGSVDAQDAPRRVNEWRGLARYIWFWGLLILGVLALAWPVCAYHRYPDVLQNWKYDYLGRMSGAYTDINQKWFYYGPALAAGMAPWTPACLIGLIAAAWGAMGQRAREAGEVVVPSRLYRFVLCWAIAPLIVFSIPHGKHHHYLVPFLAPWAILGAFGLIEIGAFLLARRGPAWLRDARLALIILGLPAAVAIAWFHQRIPGPPRTTLLLISVWLCVITVFFVGLARASGRLLLTAVLSLLLAGYCWGDTYLAAATDHTVSDTSFLRRVRLREEAPADAPLFINAKLGPVGNLDFFRIQFYSRCDSRLLHNLSYLRDEAIKANVVYVITRARDEFQLQQMGTTEVIDQSESSHEIPSAEGRFTLFKLTFQPGLQRYPATQPITTLQAMERDRQHPGPFLGE